ncbi:ABC-2 family transporter protein [Botrimarina colliarenosi]|uniref:ABC-2 family transporter protein n=1 Tax=Botrimarina colliarenosi TaxID=2528001 RepID=A0A5C6AHV9_9BACT|nr:ABC transporter permease subunit [Botrimarina colliarenosi]TWT99219.1 ABC-2 family transporter protein [Botrimarina colliarenosi]
MYLTQNPVLQHELLANLRRPRAFLLLAAYVVLLGGIVLLAWPQQRVLDMARPEEAQRLVGLFFFGQYLLASLMAPSFAAGAITGEKERLSLEQLLASPLRPGAIVLGKLLASLTHLAVLIFCSLPIVMLCLPLGGVGFYDVAAAYVAMISSIVLFGMISLWASSHFGRTVSALVVSYLMILPLALVGVLAWNQLAQLGEARLMVATTLVPLACLAGSVVLWDLARRRLLYPPDLGSGGQDVIDVENEASQAVGLYIDRDAFPDRLFAPPKRTDFLPEGANPIYDKEMRSEIFSGGTLMLRVVIQISMLMAIPIMGACLYVYPWLAPWHIAYVLLFNLLCGPVFSAGSVASERERQTLDLLLTTLITPWQILWGKLLAGLRVSTVLTGFLMWPVLLACVMPLYWIQNPLNLLTLGGYFVIFALACVTTSLTGLVCSTLFSKTSTALVASYLVIITLFLAPLAGKYFADTFYRGTPAAEAVTAATAVSPFAAAFALPLDYDREKGFDDPSGEAAQAAGEPVLFFAHVAWSLLYNAALFGLLLWLFKARWRVAD